MVVLKESEYLGMFDSLARFYNSEVTAHVGYTISITAILAAFLLTLFSSVVLDSSRALCWRIATAAFIVIVLDLYLLGDFIPYASLPYLYARTQFYGELSQIIWEHMGLSDPFEPGDYLTAIRERAKAIGGHQAIATLFAARLFVSRCKSKGIKDEEIVKHLSAFKILEMRKGKKEREAIMPLHRPYYDIPIAAFPILKIKKVDIFWLAYKQRVGRKDRVDKLLRLELS